MAKKTKILTSKDIDGNVTETIIDENTGEVLVDETAAANVIIITKEKRKNGTIRIRQSYKNCISRVDKTGSENTDINNLVLKYGPRELMNYLLAKGMQMTPILNHDFSKEPDLQKSMNEVVRLNSLYDNLDPEIRKQFKNTVHFLKFLDDPNNKEKLIRLGLITEKQVEELAAATTPQTTTPQKEEATKA